MNPKRLSAAILLALAATIGYWIGEQTHALAQRLTAAERGAK